MSFFSIQVEVAFKVFESVHVVNAYIHLRK